MDASSVTEEIIVKPEIIFISDEESDAVKPKKKRKKSVPKKSPQPCHVCAKIFQTGYELRKHLRTHTGERPYMCTSCGKTYSQPGHLKTHMLTHEGTKNFKCPDCDSSFYRKVELERHVKVHIGDKPHECQLCLKKFIQKGNLVMHLKTHTGEKPHECQYNNAFRVLMGLPRRCSASGMFAEARVDGFAALMRKRSASLMERLSASPNSILSVFANRWDGSMVARWTNLHICCKRFLTRSKLKLHSKKHEKKVKTESIYRPISPIDQ